MAEILNEPCGVLIVNKPQGPTSHDIVNKVRRLYSTKKVGHTGTLDPMATGVLVVLIGRAAKACEYSLSDRKIYTATLRLGVETDTEDTTGNILKEYPVTVNEKDVKDVLSGFKGRIKQIPPMYSALKVNGQKLVDLAVLLLVIREGLQDIDQRRDGPVRRGRRLVVFTDRRIRHEILAALDVFLRHRHPVLFDILLEL